MYGLLARQLSRLEVELVGLLLDGFKVDYHPDVRLPDESSIRRLDVVFLASPSEGALLRERVHGLFAEILKRVGQSDVIRSTDVVRLEAREGGGDESDGRSQAVIVASWDASSLKRLANADSTTAWDECLRSYVNRDDARDPLTRAEPKPRRRPAGRFAAGICRYVHPVSIALVAAILSGLYVYDLRTYPKPLHEGGAWISITYYWREYDCWGGWPLANREVNSRNGTYRLLYAGLVLDVAVAMVFIGASVLAGEHVLRGPLRYYRFDWRIVVLAPAVVAGIAASGLLAEPLRKPVATAFIAIACLAVLYSIVVLFGYRE